MVLCDYKMSQNRERCTERVGFYFWSDFNDRDMHFFKIMAGAFRKRLTIPQKFVQDFLGNITRTIKLESRDGSTFNVKVIKDLGKLVLGSGWEEFVSAHDLNMGDFLVFKYDGSCHLKVLIFDPSGCEKPSSVVMKKESHKYKKNESVDMEIQYNELAMKSSSDERKRSSAQKDRSKQGNKIIHIGSSSSSPDPSEDDILLPKDDQRVHFIPRYIVPCGTSLSNSMKKKLKEKVRAIHSEIPIYVCVINKSNIYGPAHCMNLSRGYADTYLPFEEQVLLLQCNGKKWQVRFVKVGKRARLWKGWKRFASDNNLQLGEICLFELLKAKQYTMNVHIFREK